MQMRRLGRVWIGLRAERRKFPFCFCRQARVGPARKGVGLVIAHVNDWLVGIERADSVIAVAAHVTKNCWDSADGLNHCWSPVPPLDAIAQACAYLASDASLHVTGIDLPVDLETGAWRAEVWARWLEHDPMNLLERRHDALRSLRLLHLDCGTRDEFHLHLGARQFTQRLKQFKIAFEYEEFDDGHMNVSYRYDVSLPKLARELGAGG